MTQPLCLYFRIYIDVKNIKLIRGVLILKLFALFIGVFCHCNLYAQAGILDQSFGVGGKVSIDFINDRDEAFVVKVQTAVAK